ncbi:MAG TPA: 4Fe-4S binding protein [Bacillota bacterium]|nr:4Fe-4S binding protein [Bacillota bacterium]HOR85192.1 4Fe-4S binding protein [Bacillota bacterium]HPL54015.1 4Fe-4S binding protein [Bacillota bacterium]
MSSLDIDKEKCVNCGACTAVCNEDALCMEKEDWTLSFNESVCTHCNACVKACPLRVISLKYTA